MYSAIAFVAVLLVACIVFAVVWPFIKRFSFEAIFKVIGTTYLFAPIVALLPVVLLSFLLVYPLIGLFAFLLVIAGLSAFLQFLGLLHIVQGFAVWRWLPTWAWFLVGSVCTGTLIYWLLNRPLVFRWSRDASSKNEG